MPSNQIVDKIIRFPGSQVPFELIDESWVRRLAESVEISYREHWAKIFVEGYPAGDRCYIVRQGKVNLLREVDSKQVLLTVCVEGDMFGGRSMISGEPYIPTALVEYEAFI